MENKETRSFTPIEVHTLWHMLASPLQASYAILNQLLEKDKDRLSEMSKSKIKNVTNY